MTKKNIEELTDLELIELAKTLENFIKYFPFYNGFTNNTLLRKINLSYCDEINLIHISEELGNRELMKNTIIEEFGVNCYALLSNGDKI